MAGIAAGGGGIGASDLDGLGVSGAKFTETMELSKGAGLGSFKAGFGALDGGELLFDAFVIDAGAEIVVHVGIFEFILGFVGWSCCCR